MASSVVRAPWCGGGLSGWGSVGETPVNLWSEDNYQAGTHRKDWERQSQGLLEISDTSVVARSQQVSVNWRGGVLIILLPPLLTRRNEHAGTSVAYRCQGVGRCCTLEPPEMAAGKDMFRRPK